jgi:hypothetical protein
VTTVNKSNSNNSNKKPKTANPGEGTESDFKLPIRLKCPVFNSDNNNKITSATKEQESMAHSKEKLDKWKLSLKKN